MKPDDYILLVYKELKGEISKEELVLLNKHKENDQEAKKIYAEIVAAWHGELLSDEEVEVDLSNLHSKMEDGTKKVFKLWPRIASIAAIFLLISTASILVYQRSQNVVEQIFASTDLNFLLPDGSNVQVMQGSSISYAKDFKSDRSLKLSGRAFFDVLSNEESPFTVNTETASITVLGTEFSVDNSAKNVIVSVIEGRVRFSTLENDIVLNANEVGVLNSEKALTKETLKTNNFNFWVRDQFRFDNVELGDVLRQLSLIFDVRINLSNLEMQNCQLSAIINGDEVEEILNAVAEKFNLEINKEGLRSFTLLNGECN